MIHIEANAARPLVLQIVDGIKQLIAERKLRSGAKLPSIRHFAERHSVSVSTVVEAYDRLVAEGLLEARQSSGFFVRPSPSGIYREPQQSLQNVRFDPLWFVRREWENCSAELTPGFGWVPDAWLDTESLRRSLRAIACKPGSAMAGYGYPKGLTSLRLTICDLLAKQDIAAMPDQILLTTGASHGLELVSQYLLRPGDAVLVDEPGYSVMMFNLRARGARLVGVPWTPEGPDLALLDKLAAEHRPRAFFTNTRLHNPTGASYSLHTAHRVLHLADQHDFIVVEDDVCSDLDTDARKSLASLDHLNRVIYLTSFSKSVSPRLRVGYIAAHPDAIEDITQIKMMTGLTSSEISERMVHEVLLDGRFRKHMRTLRDKLAEAQERTCHELERAGLTLFVAPNAGLFVWARHPDVADSLALCHRAIDANILLAPGQAFMTEGQTSPWMRFNPAYCDHESIYRFLADISCG